ncbi:hypothetical protein [Roseibium sp.]|uniref:hypothetical protein n=1 Tax=Roseibium sp. TaxID=1936156 RepID=UPI003B529612
MFRTLVVLLAFTGSAIASPVYSIDNSDGTSLACVSELTTDQHQKLWVNLIAQLEERGYERETWGARDNGDFTDGKHTVFVSQAAEGICVQYFSAGQPQIPIMHEKVAFKPIEFCPVPNAPFVLTYGGDTMTIQRGEDLARCSLTEGATFECRENIIKSDDENDYFVQARVAKQGQVLIFTPPGNEPQQFISRCDAY